ncbi:MAG: DUF4056 domain-containing protein [Bacteroidota bacterium]
MKVVTLLLTMALVLCGSVASTAKEPILSEKELASPPPRIIRTCCSFGSDMKVMLLPGVKINAITSLDLLGPHHYLGHPKEGNGIIYTRKGGFIDMGHLRDMADWTAYLYTRIQRAQGKGKVIQLLGHEGGPKNLHLNLEKPLSENDVLQLAGTIAYDLSVWHEIATWFGASSVPLVPERYSSFSIEDAYSNLLGVTIGMQALKSELSYEEAMTKLIGQTLEQLEVLEREEDIYKAMEDVRGVWWTREKRLPSKKVLLQRELQVYPQVRPWLVPGWAMDQEKGSPLVVPRYTEAGEQLDNYYRLVIRLNHKFPYKRIFPYRKGRRISQMDFPVLINQIAYELRTQKRLSMN